MKRKIFNPNLDEEEAKLSKLLFKKSEDFADRIKIEKNADDPELDKKPVWIDEDDELYDKSIIPNVKSNGLYSESLKVKYETLMGTPNWAKLDKRAKNEDNDDILRTVGHLQKKKSTHLLKGILEIKRFPKINSETNNEGPIISCVEFHPKLSAVLVSGQSGIVSLFSIGGDVNNKIHSFKLKQWKVTAAQFTPEGSEAYIASRFNHNYCVYNLVKAEPKLVQLPQVVKRPKIFHLSGDGNYIAASDGLDEVHVINTASKELLRSLKHNSNVQSVCFSPNSKYLYSYGIQGEITIWDLSMFRAIKKFYDNGCVTASCIVTSSCDRLLATGSGEGVVNVYETSSLTNIEPIPVKSITNLTTKITNLRFNSTSEILAVSSSFYPNAVKLVHLPSYHVFSNYPYQSMNLYQVDTVSFSPGSGYMAIGNNKNCAYLYRLKHYKNY